MIKKISVDDLKPGMEVVQLNADVWQYLPYLYTKPGPIENEAQIERIRREGFLHAFVNLEADSPVSDEERLEKLILAQDHAPRRKPKKSFDKVIDQARKAYSQALDQTKRIITDVKMGRQVDYQASAEALEGVIESAIQNADTIVCLSKLSKYDSYTYSHSINVAAIAVVFGEFLGMPRKDLEVLGVAGMMHDLGKTAIPNRIINKRGRLTPNEFDQIKKHPILGLKILEKSPGIPVEVMQAVAEHHEKYNGSGYPHGLRKQDTCVFGRILSLADVYDALTSDRSYKQAILPNKALAIMYGMRDQDFDAREVQLFIKCLGIFPAGSLVKLSSGNFGVVFESNPQQPLLPKIKVILDEDLSPIPARLVDLAVPNNGSDLRILECADPGQYKINLKPYFHSKVDNSPFNF
ncbi:HD-GYP domain-containing protein [Salidesulfovibrio onnuriiensis]|uniref:HD-GYP domain-containing protein n=1 Tax=Salidesulfovibrio onnuriiensis TaxID=2583823 RepID=UPI0011CB1E64|nr:HD-GYP domain-containing protein [Salidesulfovibrio onnuriiensis]